MRVVRLKYLRREISHCFYWFYVFFDNFMRSVDMEGKILHSSTRHLEALINHTI